MGEAEVILRLAMYYIKNNLTTEDVTVSIDGAHVKTGETVHFNIGEFTKSIGLKKIDIEGERWQGEYCLEDYESHIIISSRPGMGDVNIKLTNGKNIYAECKKGKREKRGQEYPLMREAIGQLVTGYEFDEKIIPMVGIPYTLKSKELAKRWSELSQIKSLGIQFALVKENGMVTIV